MLANTVLTEPVKRSSKTWPTTEKKNGFQDSPWLIFMTKLCENMPIFLERWFWENESKGYGAAPNSFSHNEVLLHSYNQCKVGIYSVLIVGLILYQNGISL